MFRKTSIEKFKESLFDTSGTKVLCVSGPIGSGKSQIFRNVSCDIFKNMETEPRTRLVVHDFKGDWTEGMPLDDEKILFLSVSDDRSVCWDIANDLTDDESKMAFAEAIVGSVMIEEKINAIEYDSAVSALFKTLQICEQENGRTYSWKTLSDLVWRENIELAGFLRNIFLSLDSAWNEDPYRIQFSIAEWLSNPNTESLGVGPWRVSPQNLRGRSAIILLENTRDTTITKPLFGAFVSVLIVKHKKYMRDMKEPVSGDVRQLNGRVKTWLLLDEFSTIRLSCNTLRSLLTDEEYAFGLRTLVGVQDVEQLSISYGKDLADIFLNNASFLFARVSEDIALKKILSRVSITSAEVKNLGPAKYGISSLLVKEITDQLFFADKLFWPYCFFRRQREHFVANSGFSRKIGP